MSLEIGMTWSSPIFIAAKEMGSFKYIRSDEEFIFPISCKKWSKYSLFLELLSRLQCFIKNARSKQMKNVDGRFPFRGI